jgi:hypothetical protein
MIRLTIAIPTFNRPASLVRTVETLLPQAGPETELLVLDNDSRPPAAESLVALLATARPGQISVVRHQLNVGGNANILRCLEFARGEWVWTLGDDDRPTGDSVRQILAAIAEHPDAGYLNFCTSIQPSRQEFTVRTLDEFLDDCDSFSNTLFISAGVFRREYYACYVQSALGYIHTSMPQVVLLLLGLMEGRIAVYSSRFIVGWDVAPSDQRWPHYLLFQFTEIVEILPTFEMQRKMAALVATDEDAHTPLQILRWALLGQMHNPNNPSSLFFVARGAWMRSHLATRVIDRLKWKLTSLAAMCLHRHQSAIWRWWGYWHRWRHGKTLQSLASVPGYRGMLSHLYPPRGRN